MVEFCFQQSDIPLVTINIVQKSLVLDDDDPKAPRYDPPNCTCAYVLINGMNTEISHIDSRFGVRFKNRQENI